MCCRAKDNTTALARSLQIMNALVCDTECIAGRVVVLAMTAAAAWAMRTLVRTCRLGGKALRLASGFVAPSFNLGGFIYGF